MNLVKLDLYGEGYYSEKTYEEVIFLLEDDYKSLNTDCDGMSVSLGQLDGKHSDVEGEICVLTITENEQENYNFQVTNDGDSLYWELCTLVDNMTEMIKRANNYIESIDSIVAISFDVKKSQVDKIKKIVAESIQYEV